MKTSSLLVIVLFGAIAPAVYGEDGKDYTLDVIGRTSVLESRVSELFKAKALALPSPFTSLNAVVTSKECALDEMRGGNAEGDSSDQFRFSCNYAVTVARPLPGCTGTPCEIGTLTERLWFKALGTTLSYQSIEHGDLQASAKDVPPPPSRLVDALHASIAEEMGTTSSIEFKAIAISQSDLENSALLSAKQRLVLLAYSSELVAGQALPKDDLVDCGSTSDARVLCLPDRKDISQKGMYVCNENDYPVWFAWGRKATSPGHPNDWRTKGWDEIKGRECERIERSLLDEEDRDDYYWYASSYRYGDPETFDEQAFEEVNWTGGGETLCIQVHSVSFNLVQPQPPCPLDDRDVKWLQRDFVKADRKGMKYLLIDLLPRKRTESAQ